MSLRCFAGFGGCLPECFQRGLGIVGGWGPNWGPPNAVGVVGEAPLEIVVGLSFSARLANTGPRRPKLLDRLTLGSYVLS